MQFLQGYRKFIFGFVVLIAGYAIDRYSPGGLTSNFLELIKFITMGFFIGNGVEHVSNAVTTAITGDSDGDGDVDDHDVQLDTFSAQLKSLQSSNDAIKTELDATQTSLATIQQALSLIISKAGFNK